MTRALSPDEFSRTLVAIVPQKVGQRMSEVYFDAVTQLHEAVVEDTPVDTGYLRAGFQATSGGQQPTSPGPRDPNGDYTGAFGAADASSAGAIARAAKTLDSLTMGFVAEYAPPVEDTHHMVKSAAA